MQCPTPNFVSRTTGRFWSTFYQAKGKYYSGFNEEVIPVPCGHCEFCQMNRKRMWALRVMLERNDNLDKPASFLTLTYGEKNDGKLHKDHIQNFHKRLRKAGYNFKTYYCGEFGEKSLRPHYHDILIGYRPDDRFKLYPGGDSNYYKLPEWEFGHVVSGEVTAESAAYVAGYTDKASELSGFTGQSKGLGLSPVLRNVQFLEYLKNKGYIETKNGSYSIPRYYLEKIFDSDTLREWKKIKHPTPETFEINTLDYVRQIEYNRGIRRQFRHPVV